MYVPLEGSKGRGFCVEILSSPKHWLEAYHVPIRILARTHPHIQISPAHPVCQTPEKKLSIISAIYRWHRKISYSSIIINSSNQARESVLLFNHQGNIEHSQNLILDTIQICGKERVVGPKGKKEVWKFFLSPKKDCL